MGFNKACVGVALVAIVLCSLIADASALSVNIFEHKHFKGRSASLDVRGGCLNVPMEWDDLTSSIDVSGCVIIYKHPGCQGPRVRLEPYSFGTAHLREINFEDKISSISPCNFNSQQQQQQQREQHRDDF